MGSWMDTDPLDDTFTGKQAWHDQPRKSELSKLGSRPVEKKSSWIKGLILGEAYLFSFASQFDLKLIQSAIWTSQWGPMGSPFLESKALEWGASSDKEQAWTAAIELGKPSAK